MAGKDQNLKAGKLSKWRVQKSRPVVKNAWLTLRQDDCLLPGLPKPEKYYVLEVPHYCMVVAEPSPGKLLLVREYKHAVGEIIWQLPAGLVDKGERDPKKSAFRELEEETGYHAGKLKLLGDFYSAPGRLSNRMFLYQASQLRYTGRQAWDSTENIQVLRASLGECLEMIQKGSLKDQASVLGILLHLQARKA